MADYIDDVGDTYIDDAGDTYWDAFYDPLAAEAGAFSLSGQAVSLLVNYVISAAAGAFTLTGQAVGFFRALVLNAAAGAFSLSGVDVALILRHFLFVGITTGASTNASGTQITPANDTELADGITSAGAGKVNSDSITGQ